MITLLNELKPCYLEKNEVEHNFYIVKCMMKSLSLRNQKNDICLNFFMLYYENMQILPSVKYISMLGINSIVVKEKH
jgi:hypothetical protein